MAHRSKGPRLYLDLTRGNWSIRDGGSVIRTGRDAADVARAEQDLAEYIQTKYAPAKSVSPSIADILHLFSQERLPFLKSRSAKYNISNLGRWWGGKNLTDVTAQNVRAYCKTKTASMARADLEKLGSAIRHWHVERGPLDRIPAIQKPPASQARERWLTRSEAARLAWRARKTEHLKRIVLIALHTGTRYGAIRSLEWSWIDLNAGTMKRRAPGAPETANKRTPEIRIPRKLIHFLRRWKVADGGKSNHVVHYMGRPLARDPHASWSTACNRAGVEGASLHTLRHTLATWLMQRKVDPFQAAGFLGMSLKQLTRYAKHHPDHQREAAGI